MSPVRVLTHVTTPFEAARQLDAPTAGHRTGNLHGHSFAATVFADLPEGFAAYPGGEVDALQAQVQSVVKQLDYAHLNRLLDEPTDARLAQWLHAQLDVPGVTRIALQSTATQGADLDHAGALQVWRRYRFQAAHFLPNVPKGHKCGKVHGHGFEVVLHAQATGGASVVNYENLDAAWAPLRERLDHQFLNAIDGLVNPTSEQLSAWIWRQLRPVLPALSWVTVFETGSCGANFDGVSYRIWKAFTLDSAVRVARAPTGSARHRLHGYTYGLRLYLEAPLDKVMGWALDFGDVKTLFDPLFKQLDHHALHDLPGLLDGDVASVAQWVLAQSQSHLPALYRVDLQETPGTGCSVSTTPDGPIMPV